MRKLKDYIYIYIWKEVQFTRTSRKWGERYLVSFASDSL